MTAGPAGSLVDAQLAAYNRHDLDAFAACYDDGIEVHVMHGERIVRGLASLRAHYAALWRDPARRAVSVGRLIHGAIVIEHERVTCTGPDGEPTVFDALLVFETHAGRITRVTFVRP